MKENLAVVFPGQGSQAVGMLAELASAHTQVGETFKEASDVLGYDLWALTQDGPADKLNRTSFTQPAMLVAGVSVWRVWSERGGATPKLMAGHSLGEYTALVCAGTISFTDGVKLVAERSRLMEEAVPAGQGGMAAIVGLESDQVDAICQASAQGQVLAPANYNATGQIVVS